MDPSFSLGFINLATLALYNQNPKLALDWIKKSEEINTENEIHYLIKAQAYWILNQPFNATESLNKSLEINPENENALLLLGDIYFTEKKLELAFKTWNLSIKSGKFIFCYHKRLQYLLESPLDLYNLSFDYKTSFEEIISSTHSYEKTN